MKIGIVVSRFPAVSETYILRQIVGLLDRGNDVRVIAYHREPATVVHRDLHRYGLLERASFLDFPFTLRGLVSRNVRTGLSCWLRAPGRTVRQWARTELPRGWRLVGCAPFVSATDFDVVHAHLGSVALRSLWMRRLTAAPFVVSFHGADFTSFVKLKGPTVYAGLFPEAAVVTGNNAFTTETLRRLGCPAGKLVDLPVGVPLSRFRFMERERPEDGAINFLTVARLEEVKGLEFAIRAMAHLRASYPQIRYRIIGDGPLRPTLAALIAELRLADIVTLSGLATEEEVAVALDQAHIFLLPSISASNGAAESQGSVLQEAQAAGLPVVTTDTGGIRYGVLPGKSALLVPEQDSRALAERLGWLLEHPEVWGPMGRTGRELVERLFDSERLIDRLVDIYERARADRLERAAVLGAPQEAL